MSFLQFEITPFEGLMLYRVTSPEWKRALLQRVYSLCNADSRANFPAPLPLSLERSHFDSLRTKPYWICEKTDGTRCLLLMMTLDGVNIVLLMDRAKEFYHVEMKHVPKAMFEDTVLDGELVFANGSWHFLIFDAMAIGGLPFFDRPLSQRLHRARQATAAYTYDDGDTFVLVHKNFYRTMPEFLNRHEHGMFQTDGIVLTPENDPILPGRKGALYKWKTDHTVDFKVKLEAGKVALLVYDPASKNHICVGRLAKCSTVLQDGEIIEARLGHAKKAWEFVKRRTDKDRCNDKLTFEKTKLNLKENVTLNELAPLFVCNQ